MHVTPSAYIRFPHSFQWCQAMLGAARRSVRIVILFSAALATAACGGAQARQERHMQRGMEYFTAENYDKARIEFGNALQIAPQDAEARFMIGRTAEKLGKVRDAVSGYEGAIDVNPDHVQARANLSRVYVFAGMPDKAMEVVEPGLAKHPDDADLLVSRGAARVQLKDTAGAVADAERATQLAPGNENAVALLASLYRQTDSPQKAVGLLEKATARIPQSVDLRLVLASLYASLNDADKAKSTLREIVRLKPANVAYRVQLALLHARLKETDEAQRVLREGVDQMPKDRGMKLAYVDFVAAQRGLPEGEKALREFIAAAPEDYDLQLSLGNLQERQVDTKAAEATYRKIADTAGEKPQGLSARTRIAALLVRDRKPDEAGKLIAEVLAKNPRDNDALILRGNLALERGDAASAITDLRAVLRDQPEAVGVMRVLARAHMANDEVALAEEHLRKAMSLAPADTSIRVELVQFLTRTRRTEQAIALAEETVKAAPSDVAARETLARIYLGTNQLDKARTAAEDLKILRPDLAVGYYIAGSVAANQKRLDDARKDLSRALELQPSAMDALTALTRLDVTSGQTPAAIARVQSLVSADANNSLARNMLGELQLSVRNYAAAAEQFEDALRIAPRWSIPYRNLGLVALAQKDVPRAIAVYQKGVAATNQDISLVADLATLFERQGQPDEAIKLLESVLVTKPRQEVAANNLAMLLVTHRKDAASIDRARDLTAPFSTSNSAALLDTFGWVRFKRGDQVEGLSALERAHELQPDSRVIRFHLAMAQVKAGQKDKARQNLQASLDGEAVFSEAQEARAALAQLDGKAG
jgi:tetratricopeptide (TPR) repeat protein